MNEFLTTATGETIFTNKKLTAVTKKIIAINTRVKKNLFEIALTLATVDTEQLFIDDGFKSANEYALKTFGYKKSFASNLIRIGREYTAPTLESNLPHENSDFTVTQIVEMLPLSKHETVVEAVESGDITPEMTCSEIRNKVKEMTKKETGENEKEPKEETETETEETENPIEREFFNAKSALEKLVFLTNDDAEIAHAYQNILNSLLILQ